MSALDALQESLLHAKSELRGSRKQLDDAFRRGPIDEASFSDIFVTHDTVIRETRRQVVSALGPIHEALDDRQREEVAAILERGFGHAPWRRHAG